MCEGEISEAPGGITTLPVAMTQNALPGPPAPVDTQEEQERSQQPSQNPLQEVHGAWMERAWRMGVTASSFFCLCLLSQITASKPAKPCES
ncbi:hypothetical protein AAFF_G00179630 [Aldrovandia affinis]|uniref:Uncharacterized protein n=1 Tax=Aldrovandia affinis TaxID=143900 RepID=A0AAD7R072_9TELE|nr:hypothetical protein AAFF_G00179630 [Aldrovandia affinis]